MLCRILGSFLFKHARTCVCVCLCVQVYVCVLFVCEHRRKYSETISQYTPAPGPVGGGGCWEGRSEYKGRDSCLITASQQPVTYQSTSLPLLQPAAPLLPHLQVDHTPTMSKGWGGQQRHTNARPLVIRWCLNLLGKCPVTLDTPLVSPSVCGGLSPTLYTDLIRPHLGHLSLSLNLAHWGYWTVSGQLLDVPIR